MKKLYLAILALLCCAALTTPVYADIAVSPFERSPLPWIAVIVALPIVAFILYMILRTRKK